jgi:DNA invertase Pin-like site-specific DNA recombinase
MAPSVLSYGLTGPGLHTIESHLIRLRTREGVQVARAKGRRLRGKRPKLKPNQAKHLLELYGLGRYSVTGLAELFRVGR